MKMNKYWGIALSLFALLPSFTFANKLTLTDSIQRVTTAFPIQPSLSSNGQGAYLIYEINVDNTTKPPVNLIAEIFSNQNGKLVSTATLIGDEEFPVINVGAANPDFTRFALVDDNNDDKVRLRLFDSSLHERAVAIFDDFQVGDLNNPAYSAGGGVFSEDGRFVLLSYLTDATPNQQKSVIRVLKANDLSEVTSITVNNGTAGGVFFSINDKTYITFSTYGGNYIFLWDNPEALPPSTLHVYELENQSLRAIASVQLPRTMTDTPTIFTRNGKAFIGVGTVRADLAGEVTIFADNSQNQSFIRDDARELRVYRFNGRELKLAFAKETGIRTNSPIFSPRTGHVLVNAQAVEGCPGFFNLFKISKHGKLSFEDGTYASPPFFNGVFSENGKWLLVTGSDETSALNNINLYRVKIKKQEVDHNCH